MRELFCAGMKMTSEEWLAAAGLLFGKEATIPGVGRRYVREKPIRYGCPGCDNVFESFTTPTVCPRCNQPPGNRGVTVTHKGFTGITFPFA